MEVRVCVQAEDLERGLIKRVSEGYFFMVSLDRNGRPARIPQLLIENQEQQRLFDEAVHRIETMKAAARQTV